MREKVSVGSRGQRKDQIKWKRTLPELLNADPTRITRILVEDKILPNWAGKKCPRCGQGTLSVLVKDTDSRNQSTMYKHRCSKKSCSARVNPHHLHPIFTEGAGPERLDLQTQSAALLLKLHRVPQATIHLLLNINHQALEDMEKKICRLRQDFVEKQEKTIIFGNTKQWVDVEADEATFDKKDVSKSPKFQHLIKKKNETVLWEQWAGIVQRGRPDTLILRRLTPKLTVKRSPGPRDPQV